MLSLCLVSDPQSSLLLGAAACWLGWIHFLFGTHFFGGNSFASRLTNQLGPQVTHQMRICPSASHPTQTRTSGVDPHCKPRTANRPRARFQARSSASETLMSMCGLSASKQPSSMPSSSI